jgi:hypothetical protein
VNEAQLSAILQGDLSGLIVAPAFIHVANLIGFLLSADPVKPASAHEYLLGIAMEALAELEAREVPDPSLVQIICCFVGYNMMRDNKDAVIRHLNTAAQAMSAIFVAQITATEAGFDLDYCSAVTLFDNHHVQAAHTQLLFMERTAVMGMNCPIILAPQSVQTLPRVEVITPPCRFATKTEPSWIGDHFQDG